MNFATAEANGQNVGEAKGPRPWPWKGPSKRTKFLGPTIRVDRPKVNIILSMPFSKIGGDERVNGHLK